MYYEMSMDYDIYYIDLSVVLINIFISDIYFNSPLIITFGENLLNVYLVFDFDFIDDYLLLLFYIMINNS
jgi:hypothetical protein